MQLLTKSGIVPAKAVQNLAHGPVVHIEWDGGLIEEVEDVRKLIDNLISLTRMYPFKKCRSIAHPAS